MCKPAVHCQTGMNHIFTQKLNLIPIVAFVQPHWLWSPFCIQWGSNSPLALSARDNLESSFSYVEEAERNRAWRLQICELQLYSPFLSLSLSLSLSSLQQGGGKWEVTLRENWRSTWSRKIWESDPVVFWARTAVQPHRPGWSPAFKVPAKRLSSSARWAHPFVCYLNPGFGEIQSWLNHKSIWGDKEHLGNGFSLPV